jgi:hypothetical protein
MCRSNSLTPLSNPVCEADSGLPYDRTEPGTDQFLKLEGQVTLVPDDQSRTACANSVCPMGKR